MQSVTEDVPQTATIGINPSMIVLCWTRLPCG